MIQKYLVIGVAALAIFWGMSQSEFGLPIEESSQQKQAHQGRAMGTSYSVVYFNTPQHSKDLIEKKIDLAIQRVNDQMSTYKSDSNLSIFNQKPEGSCYQFPLESYHVISMAQDISVMTHGAFDITVGPLVNLWGFGPDYSNQKKPDDELIKKLLSTKVGYQFLELKDNNVVCKNKDVYVDLSAIAKGYAVDLVAQALLDLGIDQYLVEIGGELKAHGLKANGEQWRVAVENPESSSVRSAQSVVQLIDQGIATSGDYRNYFEVEGERFSHTINPVTGYPIRHNLASVSVLHESVAYADALATALNVVGPEKALEIAEENKLAVYLLINVGESFEVKRTESFARHIVD